MKRIIEFDNHGRFERKAIKEEIANTFGVTTKAVSLALTFQRNSTMALKIREMAIQKGGVLYEANAVKTAKPVRVLDRKGNTKQIVEA